VYIYAAMSLLKFFQVQVKDPKSLLKHVTMLLIYKIKEIEMFVGYLL